MSQENVKNFEFHFGIHLAKTYDQARSDNKKIKAPKTPNTLI